MVVLLYDLDDRLLYQTFLIYKLIDLAHCPIFFMV